MYASLISAGASQLYDLYKNVTGSSSNSATNTSFDPSSSTISSSGASGTTAGRSGSSFSSALQKLFVDLQAGTTAAATSTGPASAIAGDLPSVSKDSRASGAHGHPFQGSAPSLLAYAKTHSLTASAPTSLTA